MLRVSIVLSCSGEGTLRRDKQTFVGFPKHAEMLELILAGETEPEQELGTRSGGSGGSGFLTLPLCATQLYYLHQIFSFFKPQFILLCL